MTHTWLEVRSCGNGGAKELDTEAMRRLPALMDAIKVAEDSAANIEKSQYWEYSVRLTDKETDEVTGLFAGTVMNDDGRSIRRTAIARYNNRCYTLTLFAFKE